MKKEFIPYEQALALKELGSDEPCFGSYVKLTETQNTFFMNDVVSEIDRETPLHESLITKAPTFSQAFRWFREKYDLIVIIDITYINGRKWRYRIETPPRNFYGFESLKDGFDTHEESELACLKKLIEIVKGG